MASSEDDGSGDDLFFRPRRGGGKGKGRATAAKKTWRDEVKAYLDGAYGLFSKEETVLTWWQKHERELPILARAARDFFAVPIATVGVERVFNHARDIITFRRNRLGPEMIQNLMILKVKLQDKRRVDRTEEAEKERYELMIEAEQVIEDEPTEKVAEGDVTGEHAIDSDNYPDNDPDNYPDDDPDNYPDNYPDHYSDDPSDIEEHGGSDPDQDLPTTSRLLAFGPAVTPEAIDRPRTPTQQNRKRSREPDSPLTIRRKK